MKQFLVEALKNEEIGHAVLDVFETEPLPEENELWALPNCTVSPHVSSLSGKYVERALVIFEENLEKWLKGDTHLRIWLTSKRLLNDCYINKAM